MKDVSFLNSSLGRVDNVSQQVESFKGVLDSLSSRLDELARLNGDAVLNNTDVQDITQAFGDRILQLEVFVVIWSGRVVNRNVVPMLRGLKISMYCSPKHC